MHRAEVMGNSDYEIVLMYQLRYRGIANYYQMAQNVAALSELKWVMEISLTKTLAHKHKCRCGKFIENTEPHIKSMGNHIKDLL